MYYDTCNRNQFGLHVATLLKDLKNGTSKELILDLRNNFLSCDVHYGLYNTYVSLEDTVLVSRYGVDYVVIDCEKYVKDAMIYDFLSKKIDMHNLLVKRDYKEVYHGQLFWDNHRPFLKITL